MQAWPLFIRPLLTMWPRRGVEVGVVEDDGGGLAAELEGDAAQVLRAELGDVPAGGAGTGEGDLVDARVGDEVLAVLAAGGDDVQHARGQADLLRDLGQQVGVERGLRRRLEHHGAAGDQRGGELERGDEQRDVPGNDRADDADGLLAYEHRAHDALCAAPRTGSRRPCRA